MAARGGPRHFQPISSVVGVFVENPPTITPSARCLGHKRCGCAVSAEVGLCFWFSAQCFSTFNLKNLIFLLGIFLLSLSQMSLLVINW